jgi:hypothetical protein
VFCVSATSSQLVPSYQSATNSSAARGDFRLGSVGRHGFMEPGGRVRFTPPILLGFSKPEFGPGTSPSADDGS